MILGPLTHRSDDGFEGSCAPVSHAKLADRSLLHRPILPDQLRPGLRLVFCGSAAGTVSAMRGAYYAGPGNRFWPTLAAIGLTPRRFAPAEFALLLDLGIGLTDMAKYAFGRDTVLRPEDDDRAGLAARIRACRPALLAFNGKRAAAAFLGLPSRELQYGDGPALPDFPPVFVLPSTSGAATGHWDITWWHALAARVPPLNDSHRASADAAATPESAPAAT